MKMISENWHWNIFRNHGNDTEGLLHLYYASLSLTVSHTSVFESTQSKQSVFESQQLKQRVFESQQSKQRVFGSQQLKQNVFKS